LLSVILSYSSLLRDDTDPRSDAHHDLGEIVKAGTRAAELTRKLLLYSRHDPVVPRAIDLGDVLAGLAGMLRRLIPENIELQTAIDRPLGRIAADPGLIEQVVLNLAVNAGDAMQGGGKLLIEATEVTLDEAYAREHVDATPGPHV